MAMVVIEETELPDVALPVAALKRHLRLGTGFDEADVQGNVLCSFLRAALAAIEGRTGKALVSRSFTLRIAEWRDPFAVILPVAPVTALTRVSTIGAEATVTDLELAGFRLVGDTHGPKVVAVGGSLPSIPSNGAVEIEIVAGYGPAFGDLPGDLAQAVLLLAAHYYEYRDETALSDGCMPFGVTSLISRYRRLGLGAAR
jgi:uncharacterized phiE125 gp8 family phage protein